MNEAAPDTASAPARLVLVVDDSEDSAELLAMLLEDHGYRTQVALHGARALELAAAERPNVVILDLELPDMDGFELAREMRRRFGDEPRLVAFTGHSAAEQRERARQSGIDAFVTKPFLPAKLEALLGPSATAYTGSQHS